ncbi:hypothetical protein LP419_39595 [Massilia sp. H-1]|nr:hypothetical protein LP419_39595 [Massilia sp. H-1]
MGEANTKSSSESSNSASSDGPAVAASIAVNYINSHNTASVATGVTIGATGDLAVSATRSTDVIGQGISTATNTDADTGVAAAISLNIACCTMTRAWVTMPA